MTVKAKIDKYYMKKEKWGELQKRISRRIIDVRSYGVHHRYIDALQWTLKQMDEVYEEAEEEW